MGVASRGGAKASSRDQTAQTTRAILFASGTFRRALVPQRRELVAQQSEAAFGHVVGDALLSGDIEN